MPTIFDFRSDEFDKSIEIYMNKLIGKKKQETHRFRVFLRTSTRKRSFLSVVCAHCLHTSRIRSTILTCH